MNLRKKFSGQYIAIAIFLIITALGVIRGFSFEYSKYIEYKEEIAMLNKKIEGTDSKINRLKANQKNSYEDLEDEARKRLNMVKKNEIVYIDVNQ